MLFWIYQVQSDKTGKSLKGQLASVTPLVEELNLKKEERLKQFADIKSQIEKISGEISGYSSLVSSVSALNLEGQDLSLRKLMEYQSNLRALQKEKVCAILHKNRVKLLQNVPICLLLRWMSVFQFLCLSLS